MFDLFIIAFLVIVCLALCFICWYQDEQLTQKDGYIGRIEREKRELEMRLSRVPASAMRKVYPERYFE